MTVAQGVVMTIGTARSGLCLLHLADSDLHSPGSTWSFSYSFISLEYLVFRKAGWW